jgi:sialidase-1
MKITSWPQFLAILCPLGLAPIPALADPLAEILQTKIICREPGEYAGPGSEYGIDRDGHPIALKIVRESDRYLGWGTVAKLRDGELIVSFSGDRDAHVDPWGKTQIIRSPDQGRTWSGPRTITSTPLDDRDSGIIQTRTGTLVVSWFTSLGFTEGKYYSGGRYARHAEKIPQEIRQKWLGNWIRRSEDNGATWEAPIRVVSSGPHGPVQLQDGRLLYIGTGFWGGRHTITIEESKDDGQNWTVIATIGEPRDLVEPHLVQLASGKILAMFRRENPNRDLDFLLQSESPDGGRTWTPLHNSGIWGFPPHLLQLRNGWVLVSYGYRRPPFSERACISKDEGRTWDTAHPITLNGAPGPDMGYPSSVQLDDGSILTVYYQAQNLNQPTCFMSTHWRLQ